MMQPLGRHTNVGFSLVEMLVSMTIMLIVFGMVFSAFIQARKISRRNQMDAEIIQNARIGLDEMSRTLRMVGYRRDKANGQVALIEAAPFQIIFNADVDEKKDALSPGTSIKLYDATDYIAPLQNYTTGAETIRWTLDSDDNGIVDQYDTNDNSEERLTANNANDMVLLREINGGWDQQITLGVIGPFDAQDQRTNLVPMFQYWLREANDTFSLLGDENHDGKLDGDERYFRSITSQLLLKKIQRIQIAVTTESDALDPVSRSSHRRIRVSSEVSLRN